MLDLAKGKEYRADLAAEFKHVRSEHIPGIPEDLDTLRKTGSRPSRRYGSLGVHVGKGKETSKDKPTPFNFHPPSNPKLWKDGELLTTDHLINGILRSKDSGHKDRKNIWKFEEGKFVWNAHGHPQATNNRCKATRLAKYPCEGCKNPDKCGKCFSSVDEDEIDTLVKDEKSQFSPSIKYPCLAAKCDFAMTHDCADKRREEHERQVIIMERLRYKKAKKKAQAKGTRTPEKPDYAEVAREANKAGNNNTHLYDTTHYTTPYACSNTLTRYNSSYPFRRPSQACGLEIPSREHHHEHGSRQASHHHHGRPP